MRDDVPFPELEEGSAVAIGMFDGVHLGHRHVLADTRRLAAEHRAASAVLTFDRHPATVVRPESAPLLLTDLEQRLELLADTGVDLTYVIAFDEVRAKESAEDFVVSVLVDGLRARAVTVGEDFHFGHRRRGDVALLTAMGREYGFEVDGIDLVASKSAQARAVSSTAIRSALAAGEVDEANRMLGRPHEVRGVVQPGDQRGRELGFPTANVAVPAEIQLPADGIYAGWYVRPDGSEHVSAISLGRRPTFYEDADASLLEVNLLDFDGDLYGEAARVRFGKRLRGEIRFGSVDAIGQMRRDVEATRVAFGEPGARPLTSGVTLPEPAARQVAAAEAAAGAEPGEVASPRLVRFDITLDDGHRVQVTVAGRGIPLVAVHGLSAEGLLYAQSLSRLVRSGFKVVAIDTAGHGGTDGLRGGRDLSDYAKLLARVIEHLGIGRAVFLGHSMGGRLVTEVVATDPRRAIAVLLVDAIVGDTWDRMVQLYRLAPPMLAVTGASLTVDTITTFPLARNPRQAVKLAKLWAPVLGHNLRRPWQVVAAGWSILRSGSSRWMLDLLADEQVPVFVIHGARDHAVPLQTGRDAANRSRAQLVVVEGATHAWVLRDPETLPAILDELLDGALGAALRSARREAGLDADATIDDIERAFYHPGSRALMLTPPLEFQPTGRRRRPPSYHWSTERSPG